MWDDSQANIANIQTQYHTCMDIMNIIVNRVNVKHHSQFIRTECGFLEPISSGDVIQNLIILNTRIWGATQTEHLPARDTI